MANDFDSYMQSLGAVPSGAPSPEQRVRDEYARSMGRQPQGFLGKTADILARGQYASAGLAYTLADEGVVALGKAVGVALQEFAMPEQRYSFRDVIEKVSPEFVENNPRIASTLGFAGDVIFDPTTYVSFGVSGGSKLALKGGAKLLGKKAAALGSRRGDDLLVTLNRAGQEKLSQLSTEEAALRSVAVARHENLTRNYLKKGFDESSAQALASHRLKSVIPDIDERVAETTADFARAVETRATKRLSETLSSMDVAEAGALVDAGGIKLGGKNLVSGEMFRRFSDGIGLTATRNFIRSTQLAKNTRRLFSRNADIPPELLDLEQRVTGYIAKAEEDAKRVFSDYFGQFSREERERVTEIGQRIEESVAAGKEAKQLPAELARVQEKVFNRMKATDREKGLYVRFRQMMNELAETEQAAGTLKQTKDAYWPRYYEAIHNANSFSGFRRKLRMGLARTFSPGEARKFSTIAEAKAAGYSPIMDAGRLYLSRVMESKRRLAHDIFDSQKDEIVNTFLKSAAATTTGKNFKSLEKARKVGALDSNLERHIKQHIAFVGEGIYSNVTPDEINAAVRMYDRSMSAFRKFATVVRPAFGARQAVSNTFQRFIVGGVEATGVPFDPSTFTDAALWLGGKTDHGIVSVFGRQYSGREVMGLAREYGVLKNVSVEGIGRGPIHSARSTRDLATRLDRHRTVTANLGNTPAAKGMAMLMETALDYTNVPAMIEDYSRLAMFGNLLRAGHSADNAVRLVDKALFDYTTGLSKFEQRFMRRVIPFYSFQRFAIPMMAAATAKTPGRVANSVKAGKTLMEVVFKSRTGEELTPAERAVLPGWLVEQPEQFMGFDEEMRAKFATANNYTPLDVMGFIQSNDKGEFDLRQSLVQASLSQLAPLIKVPMEFLLGEDFFTGRSLENVRNGGDLDVDALLENLVSMSVAGGTGNAVKGAAAKALVAGLTAASPEVARKTLGAALGMEEGMDPRTGKRTVYFNPYRFHLMTSVLPGLNEAIKGARNDKTAEEKARQLLFGVPTIKLDLQEQKRFKLQSMQREKSALRSEAKRTAIQNRASAHRKAMIELRSFLQDAASDVDHIQYGGEIRGDGVP